MVIRRGGEVNGITGVLAPRMSRGNARRYACWEHEGTGRPYPEAESMGCRGSAGGVEDRHVVVALLRLA